MSQPILTIAVPTYNRSGLLDLCLSQLIPQVRACGQAVELFVSDNASTDDTGKVVARHLAEGAPLRYIRNETNVGADRNFAQCYRLAAGRFVMMISDDDVLLEGGLDKLLAVLRAGNPGVVHVRSYSFKEDFRTERPRRVPTGATTVYADRLAFAEKVNVNLTFISGNVVNKALVGPSFRPEDFLDTHLVQLGWILTAALQAESNVHLDDFLIAAKAENTGGYQLCTVFGVNMNRIFQAFEARGADPEFFRIINRKTITRFFPDLLLKLRLRGHAFESEDAFETLRPVFRGYPALWAMAWPAARWPVPLAKVWFKGCREGLKALGRW